MPKSKYQPKPKERTTKAQKLEAGLKQLMSQLDTSEINQINMGSIGVLRKWMAEHNLTFTKILEMASQRTTTEQNNNPDDQFDAETSAKIIDENEKLRSRNKRLETENRKLKPKNEELSLENVQLKTENHRLESSRARLKSLDEHNQKTLRETQRKLESTKETLRRKETENKELQSELEAELRKRFKFNLKSNKKNVKKTDPSPRTQKPEAVFWSDLMEVLLLPLTLAILPIYSHIKKWGYNEDPDIHSQEFTTFLCTIPTVIYYGALIYAYDEYQWRHYPEAYAADLSIEEKIEYKKEYTAWVKENRSDDIAEAFLNAKPQFVNEIKDKIKTEVETRIETKNFTSEKNLTVTSTPLEDVPPITVTFNIENFTIEKITDAGRDLRCLRTEFQDSFTEEDASVFNEIQVGWETKYKPGSTKSYNPYDAAAYRRIFPIQACEN